MKRVALVLLLLLALALPAAAQLPPNPAVVDPALFEEIGTYGGELVLGLSAAPRSFNFYGVIDNNAYTVLYNILDPLVAENPATGELIPALAERWEVDETGTQVTFYLRDVLWSDGTPFTADDVVFTMVHVVMNPNAEGNSVDRFTPVSYTHLVCAAAACDLRAVGINMNLAPVVDVNSNPHNPVIGVRSFGEDPHLVASLGAAAIRGYQRYLAAVAKHFPGHGDVDLDPHHHLPVLSHGRQRLEEIELVPFRAAVAAGVAGIMAAHVVFPALESREKLPASLSPRVLTGLLREELGYEGLIITDCMEMAAIKQTVGTVEGAVQAIAAGADLAIISHSEDLQAQALDVYKRQVELIGRSSRVGCFGVGAVSYTHLDVYKRQL